MDLPLALYREHASNASRDHRSMIEDELSVVTKMLPDDPALWTNLGRDRVRRRLSDLAFEVWYQNVEAGDLQRARGYFATSLRHDPLRVDAWMFWASTLLPARSRATLQSLKKTLVAASQHAAT